MTSDSAGRTLSSENSTVCGEWCQGGVFVAGFNIRSRERRLGCSSVAEHGLSMGRALGSFSSTKETELANDPRVQVQVRKAAPDLCID